MNQGLLLLDQLNKSVRTRWTDFYDVFQQGVYTAAVIYTPDRYLINQSKSEYIKFQQTNVVSPFYFDDDVLVNITERLSENKLSLVAIDWMPEAKQKIDEIDLDEVNSIDALKRAFPAIRNRLFPEEQAIMKLTFIDPDQKQFTINSFGRVGVPKQDSKFRRNFLGILL